MSETKRDNSLYQSQRAVAPSPEPGIEESQPRQTIEVKRAMALWQSAQEQGGDPYNAVGRRAIAPKVA